MTLSVHRRLHSHLRKFQIPFRRYSLLLIFQFRIWFLKGYVVVTASVSKSCSYRVADLVLCRLVVEVHSLAGDLFLLLLVVIVSSGTRVEGEVPVKRRFLVAFVGYCAFLSGSVRALRELCCEVGKKAQQVCLTLEG